MLSCSYFRDVKYHFLIILIVSLIGGTGFGRTTVSKYLHPLAILDQLIAQPVRQPFTQ